MTDGFRGAPAFERRVQHEAERYECAIQEEKVHREKLALFGVLNRGGYRDWEPFPIGGFLYADTRTTRERSAQGRANVRKRWNKRTPWTPSA